MKSGAKGGCLLSMVSGSQTYLCGTDIMMSLWRTLHFYLIIDISIPMDEKLVDQYTLALVGMEHAEPDRMPDNSIRGTVWLQKIMYIACKYCGSDELDFVPCKRGMYSKELHDSVRRCSSNGLICVHQPDGNGAIHITEKGRKGTDIAKCDKNILLQMQSTKSLLNELDYRELVVYSYALYPEMAENSEIVDDFKSWRVDAATSMYLKGAASFALAASMSGMGRENFEEHLRRGGIEPYTSLVRIRAVIPTKLPAF